MKIIYSEHCTWEKDYIISDIFGNKMDVEFFNQDNILNLLGRNDLINNCIFCINCGINFDIIKRVVEFLNPVSIFWLSDEYGHYPESTILSQYTKFVFRNYNHSTLYNYPKTSFHFPLGYVSGFLSGNESRRLLMNKMDNRQISCSFVGQLKSDRYEMCSIFNKMPNSYIKPVNNDWNITALPVSPKDTFQIYYNSVFVLNGRGNMSLDCFRVYEAIVSGAIPVVVGSQQEFNNTFEYHGYSPTIIQAESWDKAYEICSALLSDTPALQAIQDINVKWWTHQIDFIRNKVAELI
jgi:hypothetical protein